MTARKRVIFYSWQSDLERKLNQNFIEDALKAVIRKLQRDDTIEVEPVMDRDTRNEPGSPEIAATIFGKIEHAHVFVCDVSIISASGAKRATPNPNVLIELGYALKTLGPKRVILITVDHDLVTKNR